VYRNHVNRHNSQRKLRNHRRCGTERAQRQRHHADRGYQYVDRRIHGELEVLRRPAIARDSPPDCRKADKGRWQILHDPVRWTFQTGEGPDSASERRPSYLGTGLGTSKSTKAVQEPSEATPGKRDIVFDFISHNPKIVGSNPTPATSYIVCSQGLARTGQALCLWVHYPVVNHL